MVGMTSGDLFRLGSGPWEVLPRSTTETDGGETGSVFGVRPTGGECIRGTDNRPRRCKKKKIVLRFR